MSWPILVTIAIVVFMAGMAAGTMFANSEAARERRRKRAEEHEEYLRREGKIT